MIRRSRHLAAIGGILAVLCLAAPSGAGSLEDVLARKTLHVCAHPDALPFSSQDRTQPGFQLELAEAVARTLGVGLTVDWIVFTRHARRTNCDAVMGAIVQAKGEGRRPRGGAQLSKPYLSNGYVFVVPRASTVSRPEDVKDGKIGVEHTSWPHHEFDVRGIATSSYLTQIEILEALAKGEVRAGMVTDAYLGWYLKQHPGGAVKVADAFVRDPELQWNVAVRLVNADQRLREAVDQAIDRLTTERVIQTILARYGISYRPPLP
jgi:polar amino acid transport system substrate-binding protein